MPESCEASVTLAGDLHARPAGALAVAAAKFTSSVELTVGASRGQQVTVRAVGPDASDAVAALIAILAETTKAGD